MRCLDYEPADGHEVLVERCRRPGQVVRLPCPAGRPDAVAAYCAEHGGEERARAEAERDWMRVAPASVGGPEEVEHAGTDCLRTPEAYVVLRRMPPAQGGVWLAWLGLGSALTPVENPHPRVRLRADGKVRTRSHGRTKSNGRKAFAARELALAAATAAWAERVRERVEEIRRARGGTLDWGTPVEPLAEPIVIDLEPGSDEAGAWEAAKALPRRSAAGAAEITGLRPSGECL